MINKITDTVAQALSGIQHGATVLIGGFGTSGNPIAYALNPSITVRLSGRTWTCNSAWTPRLSAVRLISA